LSLSGRIAAIAVAAPVALLAVLYVILLVTPIPLPLLNQQVRDAVLANLPEGSQLELGDMALTLEGFVWPVIQFRPVVYTDLKTGGSVSMDALEVGFSPIRVLFGQPGATVTVVGPHLQVNQDLFGPRLAKFDVVEDPKGGPPTVRVIEGQSAFPEVSFSPDGVDVTRAGADPSLKMRSDNDWLVYNLEAAGKGVGDIVEQARLGRFSRLVVRGGVLEMNDALYGVYRTFTDIRLDIAPGPDGTSASGKFSANFGGTVMNGILDRTQGASGPHMMVSVTNLDLSAFVPFINDPEQMISIVGASAVSMDLGYDGATGKITDGVFHVDMTGTDLRVQDDYFPIASSIAEVHWNPQLGQFDMAETQMSIGKSTAFVKGVFRLGLDDLYGPTVSMSMSARDVSIDDELGPPEEPFSEMSFRGWSAPLYGATGIDQFEAKKADGSQLASTGRIDMLRRGMGLDMTVAGDGITADDLKRLWPYFLASESRKWFVKNVLAGRIESSSMRYTFPAGTLSMNGEAQGTLPTNSVSIDITGVGVKLRPTDTMDPISIDGETKLTMHDASLTVSADGATVQTDAGPIDIANVGFKMGSETPGEQLLEISGDLSGKIPALVAFIKKQQPDALKSDTIPIDLASLGGSLSLSLVSTIVLDDKGQTKDVDYAVNGVVQDFASTAPLENHTIGNGQLSFIASQAGYRVTGQAEVDGLAADVSIDGTLEENAPPPNILLSATLDASELGKMGFDVSEFLTGEVKFAAKPMPDGSVQMAVDLQKAAVSVKDLGITKKVGTPGTAQAAIKQTGDLTEVSDVVVDFGDVHLKGGLDIDAKKGLQSAEFTTLQLSPGDSAQLALTPIRDGYQLRLRGDQLDLKPMLTRFFSLSGDSTGGPQATSINQTIALDVDLKRAVGFYKTTAFNLNLEMTLHGADLEDVTLQANLGGNRSISVATNPTPGGKVMSVAFNDLGSLLRLMNIYPNIEGGSGSLVLETVDAQKIDRGTFSLHDFSIVNEANLDQILARHQGSQQISSAGKGLAFKSGEVEFIRRSDRVEITDAVLAGQMAGGTARGFIYTDKRQYDITGTYVPLFGLNNAFQKLPIFGPLLGGREGEGLFGVSFAIRGPLDKPDFRVNPVSALVPGAFRHLFEYRSKEIPRVE
jgi:hypothetical protein